MYIHDSLHWKNPGEPFCCCAGNLRFMEVLFSKMWWKKQICQNTKRSRCASAEKGQLSSRFQPGCGFGSLRSVNCWWLTFCTGNLSLCHFFLGILPWFSSLACVNEIHLSNLDRLWHWLANLAVARPVASPCCSASMIARPAKIQTVQ